MYTTTYRIVHRTQVHREVYSFTLNVSLLRFLQFHMISCTKSTKPAKPFSSHTPSVVTHRKATCSCSRDEMHKSIFVERRSEKNGYTQCSVCTQSIQVHMHHAHPEWRWGKNNHVIIHIYHFRCTRKCIAVPSQMLHSSANIHTNDETQQWLWQ